MDGIKGRLHPCRDVVARFGQVRDRGASIAESLKDPLLVILAPPGEGIRADVPHVRPGYQLRGNGVVEANEVPAREERSEIGGRVP